MYVLCAVLPVKKNLIECLHLPFLAIVIKFDTKSHYLNPLSAEFLKIYYRVVTVA